MAAIFNKYGDAIAMGLQSQTVCDQAIDAARGLAADRSEEVYLEDDGDLLTVYPDGDIEPGWDW